MAASNIRINDININHHDLTPRGEHVLSSESGEWSSGHVTWEVRVAGRTDRPQHENRQRLDSVSQTFLYLSAGS